MKSVIFYDKDTKEIMGRGSYSQIKDIPKQYPHIEVEEEIIADSNSILEVYEEAGENKVRITGRIEDPPTVEETLAIIVEDIKKIKTKIGV